MRSEALKDEMTNGVWYDTEGGEFVTFEIENSNVLYLVPDDGDIYHEEDIDEFDPSEFRRVHDEAVDNPVQYVFSKLGKALAADEGLTQTEKISLEYTEEYHD